MAQPWPGALQDLLNAQGFQFGMGNTLLESSMDVGPNKVRRIYTDAPDQVKCGIRLERDDFQLFYDYYKTSLNGGATTFLFDHPITAVETEWRFKAPPQINYIGGLVFEVNMEWESVL
jgi:hypothetical protein